MADEGRKIMVKLESVPTGKNQKSKTREFEISQANKVLTIKKSAWKLADPNFKWNGSEIAKVTK